MIYSLIYEYAVIENLVSNLDLLLLLANLDGGPAS